MLPRINPELNLFLLIIIVAFVGSTKLLNKDFFEIDKGIRKLMGLIAND